MRYIITASACESCFASNQAAVHAEFAAMVLGFAQLAEAGGSIFSDVR